MSHGSLLTMYKDDMLGLDLLNEIRVLCIINIFRKRDLVYRKAMRNGRPLE